jgi:hypothetical protein
LPKFLTIVRCDWVTGRFVLWPKPLIGFLTTAAERIGFGCRVSE